MDLLVQGRSPTEFSLKMTEIYLKTVISDLSASVSLLLVVKPDIAFQKNLNNLEGFQLLRIQVVGQKQI